MDIVIDTHTHSLVSVHAYSTIEDNARGAADAGMLGFVSTEHGPSMQDGQPHRYFFSNFHVLPEKIQGVRFFGGVELNVLDTEGGVDLPGDFISPLDFVLAGIHEEAYQPWLNNAHSPETDTQAMLAILANPLVDGVSHPDNKTFPVDYEAVVMQAVKYGKVMEMNNGSWKSRPGSEANCRTIAALCKKHNCLVSVGSDAHYWQYVGQFSKAIQVMKDAGIAEEQVVNSSMERWTEFITRRKRERLAAVPAHQF